MFHLLKGTKRGETVSMKLSNKNRNINQRGEIEWKNETRQRVRVRVRQFSVRKRHESAIELNECLCYVYNIWIVILRF